MTSQSIPLYKSVLQQTASDEHHYFTILIVSQLGRALQYLIFGMANIDMLITIRVFMVHIVVVPSFWIVVFDVNFHFIFIE